MSPGTAEIDIPTLVVDDQPDIRLLIRVLIDMADEGLGVVGEAANGTEALERAKEVNPLVVVLDEMMPGMDGVETASRLRASRPAQIVILCSAYLDEDVVARALAAGIVQCVPKARVDELPDIIRAAVAAHPPD
jgi:DNA-binding NarL/FixJ family response regulator